jgi:F-type H+-transporting ATPase subunit epsilon
MADTFQFEIVTPERSVAQGEAEAMQIPAKRGYIGILPGHAPLITELSVGEISYRTAGKTERFSVAWGFAEVLPDKVTVLAETAERASEIDVDRARRARDRAEEQLRTANDESAVEHARAAWRTAEARIEVAEKK